MHDSSDIDMCCIVPRIPGYDRVPETEEKPLVEDKLRDHWLQHFGEQIAALPQVTDFSRIDSAANPTLACVYDGVDLDILFCCLRDYNTIPPGFFDMDQVLLR